MNVKKTLNLSYLLAILAFAAIAISVNPSAQNTALVLLIVFAMTKRVSRYFVHWLLVPINFIYNKPGSFFWERFSVKWSPRIRFVVSIYAAYLLFDSISYCLIIFILVADAISELLLHGIFSSFGIYRLLRQIFPSFQKKYYAVWFLSVLSVLVYMFIGYRLLNSNYQTFSVVSIALIIALVASDLLRWLLAFDSFVRSKKYLPSLPVTSLPSQPNLVTMLLMVLLFTNTAGQSTWNGVLELTLFVLVYVADIVVLQSDIYSDSYKGRWSELFDKPIFRYDSWFYWIVIHAGMALHSCLVLVLVWFFIFFRREWNFLTNHFFQSKVRELDGAFFFLFNNDYFGVESYEKVENKLGIQGYKSAFVFRSYYEANGRFISVSDIVRKAKFSLVPVADYSGWREAGYYDNFDYRGLKKLILESIAFPFRVLSVVEYETAEESFLDAHDARLIDRYAFVTKEEFDMDLRRREYKKLEFLFTYLDETPQQGIKILDEISVETLKLNDDLRAFVSIRGIDISNCYSNGLTPLLILHRRTHEFSMVAGRFMELLNLIEVASRWIMILERHWVINVSEDVQFSFGGVVSEIRATPFAEEVLFENADELREYKKVLQTIFGYSQKENVRFRVIDFMNWVVFIRNKTRGHGSPSRVSLDLYKLLELNTLRLLRAIAEYYDPEVLMCTEDFYVVQRGMNFDFNYYDEQPMPAGISRDVKKPFIRHVKSNGWYTSDELMTNKDNIYILSGVKKGKCEWVCYNTGELIRPDVIVF
jgi:hypothetical protein